MPIEVDELLQGERAADEVAGHILEGRLVLVGDGHAHMRREPRILPGQQLPHELFGDGLLGHQTVKEALSKQTHHSLAVPGRHGVERVVSGQASVGAQQMSMRMPLDQIAGGRDGDDEAGTDVLANTFTHGPA